MMRLPLFVGRSTCARAGCPLVLLQSRQLIVVSRANNQQLDSSNAIRTVRASKSKGKERAHAVFILVRGNPKQSHHAGTQDQNVSIMANQFKDARKKRF